MLTSRPNFQHSPLLEVRFGLGYSWLRQNQDKVLGSRRRIRFSDKDPLFVSYEPKQVGRKEKKVTEASSSKYSEYIEELGYKVQHI